MTASNIIVKVNFLLYLAGDRVDVLTGAKTITRYFIVKAL